MAKILSSGIWVNVGEDQSYTSHFRNLNTPQLSWGTPVGSETSSYLFEGTSDRALIDGPPFVLGTFTHHNFPIYLPFERFWADLKVTVTFEDRTTFDFPIRFAHFESPNRGPIAAQSDVVDLPNVKVERAARIEGVECDMLITGFYWHGLEVPSHRFHSPEGESNAADLHVQFTRYRGPR